MLYNNVEEGTEVNEGKRNKKGRETKHLDSRWHGKRCHRNDGKVMGEKGQELDVIEREDVIGREVRRKGNSQSKQLGRISLAEPF